MNKQPLFVCTLGFISGICFQDYFNLSQLWVIGGFILGIILFGLGNIKTLFFDKIKPVFLLFLFFSLGIFIHFLNSQPEQLPVLTKNKPINIVFKLEQKLNSNEKNRRYEIQILNFKNPFSAVISIPKNRQELNFLHIYNTKAYLNPTEKPQHDFQFNYQKYLARQKIFVQGYIPNEISVIPKTKLSITNRIKHQRWILLNRIEQSSLQPQNKALLKGIILADRTEIDKEIIQNFTRTGLIHILAISGSHIAIIFLLILFFLKPIFSVKYRNIPIYLSLLAIWAFAILIDYGNSVMRSCIMISIYYIMIFLQRKPDLLHSIALSALLILTWDTHQLFNIGFQFSFMAVLGIFWLYQPIIQLFGKVKNHILRFTLNSFALSFSAQLAVIPLVIYYFHQFSWLSIFINTISIFISQAFIIFSFIICILFSFNLAVDEILNIYDLSASFFLNMIAFFSRWDFSFLQNIPLNFIELSILLFIVYFLREIFVRPNLKIFLKSLFLGLLFVLTRICYNFYWEQKDEVLSHSFYQQNLISVKKGKHITFILSETINQSKAQEFIINPYFSSRRAEFLEIKILPKGTKLKINNSFYIVE